MLVYIAFGLIMLDDDRDPLELDHPRDPGVSIRQVSSYSADDLADRRARRGDAS